MDVLRQWKWQEIGIRDMYKGNAQPHAWLGISWVFIRAKAKFSQEIHQDGQQIQRTSNATLMSDVISKHFDVAIQEVPHDERANTGSGHRDSSWPNESQPSMSAWMKRVSRLTLDLRSWKIDRLLQKHAENFMSRRNVNSSSPDHFSTLKRICASKI